MATKLVINPTTGKLDVVQASVGGVSDHGALTGLGDDDHIQYALLLGRAGGQILIGGTGSGDDLELNSTSHATKGTINLGDTGYIDEVNKRFGLGNATPTYQFDQAQTVTVTSGEVHVGFTLADIDAASASSVISSAHRHSTEVKTGNAENYTGTLMGLAPRFFHNGTGTITNVRGCSLVVRNTTTGTITTGYGGFFNTRNIGGGSYTDAYGGHFVVTNTNGTITNAYGGNFVLQLTGGTITNGYGCYIDTPLVTAGTFTNTPYGIYQEGTSDRNYLGAKTSIGTTALLAQLHIDQPSTTATIPVLYLDQGDISEPFINFVGTSAASANNSISSLNTSGATTDHIQIDLNGVKAWIAVSTNNPT